MEKDYWLALIAVGSLVIGSGLTMFNTYLQTRRSEKFERKKLVLDKLEQVYSDIEILRISQSKISLDATKHLQKPDALLLEKIKEPILQAPVFLGKIGMYAPELRLSGDELLKSLSKQTKFLLEVGNYDLVSGSDEEHSRIVRLGEESIGEIIEKCVSLENAIIKLSKKYL